MPINILNHSKKIYKKVKKLISLYEQVSINSNNICSMLPTIKLIQYIIQFAINPLKHASLLYSRKNSIVLIAFNYAVDWSRLNTLQKHYASGLQQFRYNGYNRQTQI